MVDVDELISRAKPRETTVAVCLAGDLNARHEELTRQLASGAGDKWIPDSLSAQNPQLAVAEEITALEREMAEHLHVFRLRALPQSKFAELKRAHPPREDTVVPERLFNSDTFAPALIAASCVDPAFPSVAKVHELFDRLGHGAFDVVFTAAWEANTGRSDVPKSALASATIRSTASS